MSGSEVEKSKHVSKSRQKPKREEMPVQESKERIKNFKEVALGYTPEQAIAEAARCLGCKKPKCMEGCPVEIEIADFIGKIKEGKFKEAIDIIKDKNNLPAICGRVCPQEDQCEKFCILGRKSEPIAIGRLERFVADWQIEHDKAQKSSADRLSALAVKQHYSYSEDVSHREAVPEGQAVLLRKQEKNKNKKEKVAVVGAGPAGLTAAADLAKTGYAVTIFESLHDTAGVLRYGIPEFRLPKEIVDIEVDAICKLGVQIKVNMVIGRVLSLDDLREQGYSAFFIGTGAGLPYFLNIEGENLNGVYSANEFLTRVNLMKAYLEDHDTPVWIGKKVAVVGAGNVAMDSARVALRLGADEVYIIYRRSEAEMPARLEEIEHAREEGIKFMLLTNPARILGNNQGWVTGIECIRNELGPPDESGRRRPVPIEGSEFKLDMDTMVIAVGQGPNPLLLSTEPDLKLNRWGNIKADSEGQTSLPDVFAGGDIVTGAATVIQAMGAGKRAARAINEYLNTL